MGYVAANIEWMDADEGDSLSEEEMAVLEAHLRNGTCPTCGSTQDDPNPACSDNNGCADFRYHASLEACPYGDDDCSDIGEW